MFFLTNIWEPEILFRSTDSVNGFVYYKMEKAYKIHLDIASIF